MKSYQEMSAFAREALGIEDGVSIDITPMAHRGSERKFFRLKTDGQASGILISYDPKRIENGYYADIAAFLSDIGVSIPRLIHHDSLKHLIIAEDLGDTDLWSFRDSPWEIRSDLYKKTLIIVHKLHSFPEKDFPFGRVRLMEGFDANLYRWERDYFKENFVKGFCGINLYSSFEQELEAELSSLAERLTGTKRCLVHRDLQSQNVMIRNGEPFLIDFQGMRFGSLFYDLGSLLCDPYVNISGNELKELLVFYYELTKRDIDLAEFWNYFWEASAQRLMQALGAYGFLGIKKGLKTFLDHIPAGL